MLWLSSRNFFRRGKICCDANFHCDVIFLLFSDKISVRQKSLGGGGGKNCFREATPIEESHMAVSRPPVVAIHTKCNEFTSKFAES